MNILSFFLLKELSKTIMEVKKASEVLVCLAEKKIQNNLEFHKSMRLNSI